MAMARCGLKILTAALAIIASLSLVVHTDAKTFRYAFRIDPASLDPHALAETFTLSWLGQIYEPLVGRGKKLELVPALATKWEQTDPRVWRFHLRPNVKFHNGEPFSADDVVFTIARVKSEGSDMAYTVATVAEVRKVDDLTVDFIMEKPNPILPLQITSTYMMSKSWAEANGAVKPASIKAKAENFATNNTNGTGPFKIQSRQLGVKTVLVPNDDWWGEKEHNLTEVDFTPIQSDATRVAALLSGDVDMIYPVPQQDTARVNASGKATVLTGFELRTIFLNMDQKRDELLESNVKGKNPFKDIRVRKAIYQAIDINAIKDRIMGGNSHIAGTMIAPGINGYDPKLDVRMPFDPDASKKLLAEAGYPDGFEIGMDCPNDRYVNDEKICQAIVGMLARVGIKVNLLAQTRTKYFEKILSRNTTFSLLGWQPLSYDAHSTLQDVINTPSDKIGTYNVGSFSDPRIDALTSAIEVEIDPAKRQDLISQALTLHKEDIGHIPLHQAGLAWGVRKGVSVVLRNDDSLELRWVKVED
jgi:peptide/nickel transport system substrate-binding protein